MHRRERFGRKVRGNLCVELAYPQVGEEYALEVELSDAEEALPLRMMIGVTGSAEAR